MTLERNAAIKRYIYDTFVTEDPILLDIKQRALASDLPVIAVPENVGKALYMLAKLRQPRRILEIGTLAGYSTVWLARGAPEATIVTIVFIDFYRADGSMASAWAQRNLDEFHYVYGNNREVRTFVDKIPQLIRYVQTPA